MGQRIIEPVSRKFAAYGIVRDAGSVAVWVAALHHKAVYYPMKGKSVIKAAVRKLFKILNRSRSSLAVKSYRNGAVILYIYIGICRNGGIFRRIAADRSRTAGRGGAGGIALSERAAEKNSAYR